VFCSRFDFKIVILASCNLDREIASSNRAPHIYIQEVLARLYVENVESGIVATPQGISVDSNDS